MTHNAPNGTETVSPEQGLPLEWKNDTDSAERAAALSELGGLLASSWNEHSRYGFARPHGSRDAFHDCTRYVMSPGGYFERYAPLPLISYTEAKPRVGFVGGVLPVPGFDTAPQWEVNLGKYRLLIPLMGDGSDESSVLTASYDKYKASRYEIELARQKVADYLADAERAQAKRDADRSEWDARRKEVGKGKGRIMSKLAVAVFLLTTPKPSKR